jgi:integrase
MAFLIDTQELKPGLVIFRRADVKHRKWYCRVKLPNEDRYKTVSLKTTDVDAAKERAFDQDADVRFRIKHDVPIFNHPFSKVAKDWVELQKQRVEAGEIALYRISVVESVIRAQLNPYIGSTQITLVGKDKWTGFPAWRQKRWREKVERESEELKKQGKPPKERQARVSNASIRSEMEVFRAIMRFAANKKHIPESQVFKDPIPVDKVQREEFTPEEYRILHTFARGWINKARTPRQTWYYTIAYNFILIMCNTGMRPTEAKNLRWRDVAIRADKHGRKFVVLSVRGKKKSRDLVAASNVAEYLDRVRELSKATNPDHYVFTTFEGKPAGTLYRIPLEILLTESKLRVSSSGSRRSTYCFRHTYAYFRLTEGVDVYFLAKQMGTSVKMIEDHYGHINPVKNADLILQGLPGWEPIAAVPPLSQSETDAPIAAATKAEQPKADGVNADAVKAKRAKRPFFKRRASKSGRTDRK